MSETKLILGLARREATERARSKAYRVSTAILLLAALAAVVMPSVFHLGDDPAAYRVGVVDTAPDGLESALAAAVPQDTSVDVVVLPDREAAEAALAGDDPVDVVLTDEPGLVWQGEPDPQLQAAVTSAVTRLSIADRADQLGISPADLEQMMSPVAMSSTSLEDAATERRGPQALIATVGMVLMFVSITFYGSYILMSVIEEKQNRVVEVLLAHVDPRDLLAAKVLGHGALGLAQIVAIAAIATIGLLVTNPVEVPSAAFGSIASVVLWFLLGYSFYSILYGALGSLASRTEDAQSAVGPLTVLLMVAYFTSFTVINSPDSLVAVVGSFLPPTAPMMMPLRTALTDVPTWQPVLAVVIELAAIVGLVRLGGRLYRGAVLQVGRKLSLREAWEATA